MAGASGRIVRARVTPLRLPLRAPLATAHGAIEAREGALLELETDDGRVGRGEALPLPGFGLESRDAAVEACVRLAHRTLGAAADALDTLLDEAEDAAPGAPAARGALDVALHELAALGAGLPLAAWLARRGDATARGAIPVCCLVPGVAPDECAAFARRAVATSFRALKLKVGARPLGEDVARVAALRAAVGDAVELRLDANGAWDESGARRALDAVASFRIAFVEQPVPPGDVAALARLRGTVPIAADESVRDEASAREIVERGAADLLVLKPAALGGLRRAGRIAALARRAGLEVVVTGFIDGAFGTAAAAHFAAALPEAKRAAGLATAPLLLRDLGTPPTIRQGAIVLSDTPGLGVVDAAVARCASGPARELTR